VGTVHCQTALDSHVYEVWLMDGRTKELAMNAIAVALYAQYDPVGKEYVLLDAIVDYLNDPNVTVSITNQV